MVIFWNDSPKIKRNWIIITRKRLFKLANVLKLRILGNFTKILEMPGIKEKVKTLTVAPQTSKKRKKKKKKKQI